MWEMIKKLINIWMDKQIVIYLYNTMQQYKEWMINTHKNVYKSQNNYPEWKKAGKSEYVLPDFICTVFLKL